MKLFNSLLALLFALHSVTANASTYYFHNDQLGTPQVLTDADQTVVWQAEASPFGDTVETIATVEQNLRFPGQYFDRETQLHYNYFRDYDPTIGRYLQSDPIGLGGGLSTYAYVGGNPYSYADPTGEFALGLVGAMIGFAFLEGLNNLALQAMLNGGDLACISYDEVALSAAYGALFALGGFGAARLAVQLQRIKELAKAANGVKQLSKSQLKANSPLLHLRFETA